jgi:hypothetical protein
MSAAKAVELMADSQPVERRRWPNPHHPGELGA